MTLSRLHLKSASIRCVQRKCDVMVSKSGLDDCVVQWVQDVTLCRSNDMSLQRKNNALFWKVERPKDRFGCLRW